MAEGCRSLIKYGIISLVVLGSLGYVVVNWLADHPAWAGVAGVLVAVVLGATIWVVSSIWTHNLMRSGAEMMIDYSNKQGQRDKAAANVLSSASRILGRFNEPPSSIEPGINWENEFPPVITDARYEEVKQDDDSDFMA